ncbi:MAG: hypothetical protein QM689_06055 [Oscillospiraceae bacterium]
MELNDQFFEDLNDKCKSLFHQYGKVDLKSFDTDGLSTFYGKGFDTYSNGILRHMEAGKCLYKKLLPSLRNGANQDDYERYYLNDRKSW